MEAGSAVAHDLVRRFSGVAGREWLAGRCLLPVDRPDSIGLDLTPVARRCPTGCAASGSCPQPGGPLSSVGLVEGIGKLLSVVDSRTHRRSVATIVHLLGAFAKSFEQEILELALRGAGVGTLGSVEGSSAGRQRLSRRQLLALGAGGLGALGAGSYLLDGTIGGHPGSAGAAPSPGSAPQAVTLDASSGWRFGGRWHPGYEAADFDDSGFSEVNLPHTVVPLSWEGWDPTTWEHRFVYRRDLRVDPALGIGSATRCFVDFAGAMTDATVYVNGREVGRHLGGYLPFGYECTHRVHPGENVVAVVVDGKFNVNVPPDRPLPYRASSVDFWQPAGLYRGATFRVVPETFLADVFAKPVDVLGPDRRVVVDVSIDSARRRSGSAGGAAEDHRPRDLAITVALEDGARVLASGRARIHEDGAALGASRGGVPGMLRGLAVIEGAGLRDVELWSPHHPRRYTVRTILTTGGNGVHELTVAIGFRDARFTEDGFYLNGERTKLVGVCRHQFFPFAGGAMPDRVQRRDAYLVRETLNANVVRCSHYPQSEAFLDACDELGLMVWEEAPGWGYLGDEQWLDRSYDEIGNMIVRDRNHPSIVLWGVRLNETPNDAAFYAKTQALATSLDDSRQTTGAMTGALYGDKDFQQDVFGYNDYVSSGGWPVLLPPLPNKPYFVSECIGTLSGPSTHYRLVDPMWIQESQAIAHAKVIDQAYSNDAFCGITTWSGFDYPSGNGNQIDGVKYTGVIDLFRNTKPGAAIYMAQIDPSIRPVVEPAFYWDFGPKSPPSGPGANATICTNCDRLEIYVGGRHLATGRPDRSAFPHIPHPPVQLDLTVDPTDLPELVIEGFVGRAHVTTRRFSADHRHDRLHVAPDDTTIVAGGSDGTRVAFRAVDRYGAPRPYAGGEVTLRLVGPGVLVGTSPFPFAATGGAGAVWVRTLATGPGGRDAGGARTGAAHRAGSTGVITLTATHPTLGTGKARITVVAPQSPDVSAGPSGPLDRQFHLNGP